MYVHCTYGWYNVRTMYVHCTYSARWDVPRGQTNHYAGLQHTAYKVKQGAN